MTSANPEPATEPQGSLRARLAVCWDGDNDPADEAWRDEQAGRALAVFEPELVSLREEIDRLADEAEDLRRENHHLASDNTTLRRERDAARADYVSTGATLDHATDRLSDMVDDAGLARPDDLASALDTIHTLLATLDPAEPDLIAALDVDEANAALRELAQQRPAVAGYSWIPVPDDRVEWKPADGSEWSAGVVERVTLTRGGVGVRVVLDADNRPVVADLKCLRPSPAAAGPSREPGSLPDLNAEISLPAAARKAVPVLTGWEAKRVAATVLRALSEVKDTAEGWPHADDLLVLADDIEARA